MVNKTPNLIYKRITSNIFLFASDVFIYKLETVSIVQLITEMCNFFQPKQHRILNQKMKSKNDQSSNNILKQ